MVFCLMSLIGMPIFAGFVAKWWILVALGNVGHTLGWTLTVVLALNTLFSLYFYMRIVVQMTLRDDGRPMVRASSGGIALVNFCGLALAGAVFLRRSVQTGDGSILPESRRSEGGENGHLLTRPIVGVVGIFAIMFMVQVVDILNRVLSAEQGGLAERLLESTMFVSDASLQGAELVRRMAGGVSAALRGIGWHGHFD